MHPLQTQAIAKPFSHLRKVKNKLGPEAGLYPRLGLFSVTLPVLVAPVAPILLTRSSREQTS